MLYVYSDENDRLTPEIWKLMDQAFGRAMENEFGAELAAEGVSLSDLEPELGVTIVDRDGHVRCQEGEVIANNSLREKMDWLVKGVEIIETR